MVKKRLDTQLETDHILNISSDSKLIIMSDCHRGDNKFSDEFAPNKSIYLHALNHYFDSGFTYIELGDGDELWEISDFNRIVQANQEVFKLLRKFFLDERLILLYGNHDLKRKDPEFVKESMYEWHNKELNCSEDLFPGIQMCESLVLKPDNHEGRILLVHGHQADPVNDYFWRFSLLMVRYVWKNLQFFGLNDPTSPAKNHTKLNTVERRIKNWIKDKSDTIIITGHTHNPRFPKPGDIPYFNDGCCVHPRSITGLEIENNKISLIKWSVLADSEGVLKVKRHLLAEPKSILDYFR